MRYEYKLITLRHSALTGNPEPSNAANQERLNALGAQGWRLVSTAPFGNRVQAYFMREK